MDLSHIEMTGQRTTRQAWKNDAIHWRLSLNEVVTVHSEGLRPFLSCSLLFNRSSEEEAIYQSVLNPLKKLKDHSLRNRKLLHRMVTSRVRLGPDKRLICSLPSLNEVLFLLTQDALQMKPSLKEWCVSQGYYEKTKVAQETYLKYGASTNKLRLLGLRLDELKHHFEDYYKEKQCL